MQLKFHISLPNSYSDAIHGRLGQRIVKEQQMLSENIWVFNCFRQKPSSGIFSAAENLSIGQLRRRKCRYPIIKEILETQL